MIEGHDRLPSGCINSSNHKCLTVTFVNWRHSEALLRLKKPITSCSNVFITNSLTLIVIFSGGKCKDQERKHLTDQVFCLGAVVTIKVRENGPPAPAWHIFYQDISAVVSDSWICSCLISLGNFSADFKVCFRNLSVWTCIRWKQAYRFCKSSYMVGFCMVQVFISELTKIPCLLLFFCSDRCHLSWFLVQ